MTKVTYIDFVQVCELYRQTSRNLVNYSLSSVLKIWSIPVQMVFLI